MKFKEKPEWKQLGIFLLLCMPTSWLLMGIAYGNMPIEALTEENFVPWAYVLLNVSCYLPAIAAILSSVICKEPLKQLRILPRLQGNAKVYFFAMLMGVMVSCLDSLLNCLIFPNIISVREGTSAFAMVAMILYGCSVAALQFFVLLGEEIGWMGYLFPRLEKLGGTTLALVFTGLLRGCWHIVMLAQSEFFVRDFVGLCVSNILLGSILVLFTKASGSVVPAALIHTLTNTLPGVLSGFLNVDENLYQANYGKIYLVGLIPCAVIGGGCYIGLKRMSFLGKK